jgi:glycosyltransferase involved in cell wall biosynthesis
VKVAFVTPRFGPDIVGGAERAARELATRLAATGRHRVEVLTTTATSAADWADELPAGEEEDEGVVVRRFRVERGRDPGFSRFADRLLLAPTSATPEEAERFVELQGPNAPGLLDALGDHDADVVAFYPYLYAPSVHGMRRRAAPAVLHAAAHDEPALYLPCYDALFSSAAALVHHTDAERRLVARRFGVAERPQVVLGLGIDPPLERRRGAADALVGDRPFLCCLGRVDDLKGTGTLAELFAAYKARRPGPLRLVLAGPVAVRPIDHPDIVLAGAVDEATKWDLLERSVALVSPSPFESFAIVLGEAWLSGVPVVVNRRCEATFEQVRASGGGLAFGGYAELEVVLDRLLADASLRERLAERGRDFVERRLRWPVVIARYQALLERVSGSSKQARRIG